MWYVYILRCADGTFYTGCTTDVARRLNEHLEHKIFFTRNKNPISLIWYCSFDDKYKAFAFEKYLKSGSGISFRIRHFL